MSFPLRYAALLDGAFVIRKLEAQLGRFPTAADVQAFAAAIHGHECVADFALRLGETATTGWKVGSSAFRNLMRNPRLIQPEDLVPAIEQKGVDLRIGLDIARLALTSSVQAIVAVTGDSDLVPAFKFARREGLRVFLCHMGHRIRRELMTHADREIRVRLPAARLSSPAIYGYEYQGSDMDEQTLNRRQILGGMAAAGAAGLIGGSSDANAQAAPAATPDIGPSQPPQITDVKGKVAYITGGSSGIGLGIARVFHEAGMKVVIGYLDEQHIGDALKNFPDKDPRILPIKHDVMDRDRWETVADEIEKKFGGLHVLVNNAGVGLQAPASTGTYKDWEWGLGVNLWGPINGVRTYVPRMLASKQGAHIVTTTSTSGILPGSGAGIYTVAKIAAVGLMEELRHELRATNIGTSCFVPGLTSTNIGQSESYRPAALKNDGPPALAPGAQPRPAGGGAPRPPRPPAATPSSPILARPQDPMVVARLVLDGILNNDLYIIAQPEYRAGVEARCNALLDSMVAYKPLPPEMLRGNVYRTPIFQQEIAHRKATLKRDIPGT